MHSNYTQNRCRRVPLARMIASLLLYLKWGRGLDKSGAKCSNFVPSAILYPTLQPNLTYVTRSTTLGVQSTRIIFQLSETVFNDQIQCYSSISRSRLNINCTSTIKGQGISYLPTGNVFWLGFLIFYLGIECVGDVMTSLEAGLGQGSSLMSLLHQRLGSGLVVGLRG